MRDIIFWIAVIFLVLAATDRLDLLGDIGSSVRHGVDAVKEGYNNVE